MIRNLFHVFVATFLFSKNKSRSPSRFTLTYSWWFRNLANQLRLVVYPTIYKVNYTSQVVRLGISSIIIDSRLRWILWNKKHPKKQDLRLKDVVPYNIAMKFSAKKNVPWRSEVCWWHRGFHGERQLGEHPTLGKEKLNCLLKRMIFQEFVWWNMSQSSHILIQLWCPVFFFCLFVCLFACLFVCLFACFFVCLFVCLFGWLVGWLVGCCCCCCCYHGLFYPQSLQIWSTWWSNRSTN